MVARLRSWRDERGYPTPGEMLDEAADEIERLRLTDAERGAIERLCEAVAEYSDIDRKENGCHADDDMAAVAVARGLMKRMV
jgi:hypothetical protein